MSSKQTIFKALAVVLLFLGITLGQNAFAQTSWSVSKDSESGNTCRFKIQRTGDKSQAVTVRYRTVSLSAFEGQHFTAVSGNVTFQANEDKKYVDVTESTPNNGAYMYQNGTERSYRFEVTDMGGFHLAHYDRTKTTGTYVQPYNVFAENNVTIESGEITVTDDGYGQGYHSMTVSSYFNNTAPIAYFQLIGAQLRMTLSFQCKEDDDGWQYVQIYANQNINNIDSNNGAEGGNPGNCSYSRYVAGFEHLHGSKDPNYKSYTFPVTSVGNNAGADNPWGHGTGYNLHLQKFNNSRASDGRLIIPTNLTSLYIRYDASGSDDDDWVAKNTVAQIQAVDGTAPTMLAVSVAPGYHAKGNTVYVSVAFSEIVRVSGTPTLTTTSSNNWGSLSYVEGSGTNVLTFSTTIPDNASGNLNITGLSGTVKDLAGNSVTSNSVTANNLCSLDSNYAFPITYNLAGGSVSPANPTSYTYYTATFTLNNPTKLGYGFNGWTGSNGNMPQTTVSIANHSHGDKYYTANWNAHTYSVRFNANAETGTAATGTMANQGFTYGVAQNLSANAFDRVGYTFANWNRQADGGGTSYTNQQSVSNLTPEDGAIIDLYAQWDVHHYTVHFDKNKDEATGTMTDQSFTYDQGALNANAFTCTGYTFNGWNTEANGSGTSYTDQQAIPNVTATNDASVTLYAQWAPISYTVHFDANYDYDNNGIVITGTMSDQSFIYDQAQNLTANAFEREGYTFSGWATQPDGMGDDYSNQQSVNNLTNVQNGVVTLYAKWSLIYWTGEGTQGDPYLIIYPAQLLKLSKDVNDGETYYVGSYFKLGNDINMEGVTFGGIGANSISFRAVFDGDGYTISNLTINNNTDEPNVGLFSSLENAIVRNVVLDGAHVTGNNKVGAIVGYHCSGTIENCLVINSSVTMTSTTGDQSGIIIGYKNSDAVLTNNHYRNCSVTRGGNTSTLNIGTNDGDVAGARSAHTLTKPAQLIATSANMVTYNQVTYYASNVGVTITLEPGCYITGDVTVTGTQVTDNHDGTWSFIMPAANATVSATVVEYKITVNDDQDTTNYFVPFSSQYCDRGAHSQFIIPAADLADIKWGDINKMTFFSNTASASWQNIEYDIYFAEVDFTTFQDGDWISGSSIISDYHAKRVYSGGVSVSGNKMEITLDSPYPYSGGNLWVYFEENHYTDSPGSDEMTWYGKTQTDFTAVFQNNNGSGGAKFLPKITFSYTPAPSCVQPTALTVSEVTNHTATISWTANSNETNWHVYRSTDPTAPADDINLDEVIAVATTPTYTFTGLDASTKYYFWVRGNCGGGDYSSWSGSNFTTEIACAAPTRLIVSNIDHTSATLGWTSDGDNFNVKYAQLPDASNEYKYDNGVYLNVMKNIYAGVLIPASSYTESNIRKISVFDSYMNTGVACSLWICYGTPTAPDMSNPIYTGSVTYTGTNAMMDIPVGVAVDNTRNLWVVMHSDEDKYSLPACSDQSGTDANANGRWFSGNGSDWSNYKYNESYRVWMIRVTLDNGVYNWSEQTTTTNSCHITGLTDNKDYMFKVRRVCGGIDGESEWSGTSFNTRTKIFNTAGDWATASNWSPEGVPTIEDNVVIRANATIPGGCMARANQITFEGNPTPTLTLADGGKLVCNNPANVTVQKTIEAYSAATGQGNTDGWYFIASPVTEVYTPAGSMLENTYDLYRLNPANTMWENFKNSAHSDFTTLDHGRGYLYANSENVTLSFTGTTRPYDNNYGVPVSTGFNLVGNPYTFDAYVNVVYYRIKSGRKSVEFVNENFPIAPGESVIIEADAPGYVIFTNTEQPWQASSGHNGSLNIALTQANTRGASTALDKAVVSFDEGSKLGKFYFGHQDANIYIPQNGKEYAIAYSDAQGEMPLNFKAHKNGEYTLSFNLTRTINYLHLIDNLTGANIDLLQTQSYTFDARTTDYASRFKLVFNAIGAEDNGDFAFIHNGEIIVNGSGTLQLIDLLGRVLVNHDANERISTDGLHAGVYVLRLINGDNVKTQKIVVR